LLRVDAATVAIETPIWAHHVAWVIATPLSAVDGTTAVALAVTIDPVVVAVMVESNRTEATPEI
jgi:hypothetical protein